MNLPYKGKDKRCIICKKVKTIDKFYIRITDAGTRTLKSECKECSNKSSRIWQEKNLEHYRNYQKEYRLRNREEKKV